MVTAVTDWPRTPPPLGVTPEWLWREQRVRELAEAIARQLGTPGHTPDTKAILQWAEEILSLAAILGRGQS